MSIPFNQPYLTGNEINYISRVITSGSFAGNGYYTAKCQRLLEDKYGFKKCLLTSSCTDALEMCAMLIDIKPGDEVIVPAYTFVSTALAFARQGATIIFIDSKEENPCMNEDLLIGLITKRTKAIVPVHYAGIACDMDKIMDIANRNNLFVIEDAANAINSYYKGKPLGSIGHLSCLSFHETKPIHCGEGGMLIINDDKFIERAEIIWEKGTNRSAFRRGDISKYEWIDNGSSFLPSEITAAFLFSQLEELDKIIEERMRLWETYYKELNNLTFNKVFNLPSIPVFAMHNASIFYLLFNNESYRNDYISSFKEKDIQAISHYLDLSKSPYYNREDIKRIRENKNANKYEKTLLRLPLFNNLKNISSVISVLKKDAN